MFNVLRCFSHIMTELEASGAGEPPPSYMIFLVVFLFFLTGLLGFLICHLLKKKGYHCRTRELEDEEDKLGEDVDGYVRSPLVVFLHIFIQSTQAPTTTPASSAPRFERKRVVDKAESPASNNDLESRLFFLLGGSTAEFSNYHQVQHMESCNIEHCSLFYHLLRFRVTHSDKKLQGGPNSLAVSGDQLDQSQDSEERKEDGYNLKNMFKEVQPPSDGGNGVAANMGKRKKSITIFGLRRGSDPLGLSVKVRAGRETGGGGFAVQLPPVVLEEPVQARNVKANPEHGPKPAAELNTKPAPAQPEPKTSILKKFPNSNSGPQEGSKVGLSSDLEEKVTTVASAPTSLPISPEKSVNVDNGALRIEDPGPLQTSTPIDTIPAPIPVFTSLMATSQSNLNQHFMAVQASSDPWDPASSSEQIFKDRLSSLPLSPSRPLSPSSLQGGRISSVTIVKASPDSKREFSVSLVDKEDASSEDHEDESPENGFKSEKVKISPADKMQEDIFVGESEIQSRDTSGVEARLYPDQDKDDMMEMEDIRDCKVTQVEGAKGSREEPEKIIDNQPKENQEGKSQYDKEFSAFCNDPRREKNDTTN
ncbi:hypothetical protein GOODEAATRI_020458 [Goodea atripinnis]|uniref:Uncharacterized protein n=1 Tax=Goodea atripinnis TaxID=208336 RepID=A0ABV0ND73_9TELE